MHMLTAPFILNVTPCAASSDLEQASDMDADTLRSRICVLVPIYLGPIHVLTCA